MLTPENLHGPEGENETILSRRCFVISPIGQEGSEIKRHADEVLEHIIIPAMKQCGVVPYRSDHLAAPGKISDHMFARILGDDLCIAILTGFNPNVFYELAIAHAAQRPVIIMMEKGKDLPFDVKDLRCVYYDFWPGNILKGVYVEALVAQVNELKAANWTVPSISTELERLVRSETSNEICFYERSADFGPDARWLQLLEEAKEFFSIMGVSLLSWQHTRNFESAVIKKAAQGCHVRIMTLSQENASISELETLTRVDELAEVVRGKIKLSSQFFSRLARETSNIEYRQLRLRTPNFALTLTDRTALIVQYLHSLNWGLGPHLQCRTTSALYPIVSAEFNSLWALAERPP
jgi:hypothetical protein